MWEVVMSEKQKLTDTLRRSAQTDWGTAALSALDDQQVVFAGSPGGASNTAADLLRLYRLRLSHCHEHGIVAHGIAELIESLVGRASGAAIEVQPFLGPESAVIAFWDTAGNLVGCVTVLGRDPEIGRRNLDFALGKG
jgi:hypothetical protein